MMKLPKHMILLALGLPSLASGASITVPVASKHLYTVPAPTGYRYATLNEVNPGLGYVANNGLTYGMYYNSYKRLAAYMGYTSKCWILECSYLAASGYSQVYSDAKVPNYTMGVIPMMLVGYDIAIAKTGMTVGLNYLVQPSTMQVFGLVFKYKL